MRGSCGSSSSTTCSDTGDTPAGDGFLDMRDSSPRNAFDTRPTVGHVSVEHHDSVVQRVQPSLKHVWVALAIAVGLAGALLFYIADPWNWLPNPWDYFPREWEFYSLVAVLLVLGVPIVRGTRAIMAGRRAAWWPTLLAIALFSCWGLFVFVAWAIGNSWDH
jgi:hypothetical protein